MSTTIDELEERMQDDTATFTAAEVRMLIERHERDAAESAYNQARIASVMQANTQMVTDNQARWDAMCAQVSYTPPTIVQIGGAADVQD
jgi:hypothetical protein